MVCNNQYRIGSGSCDRVVVLSSCDRDACDKCGSITSLDLGGWEKVQRTGK